MNPVGESQQVWISVENGQNQSELGLLACDNILFQQIIVTQKFG